MDSNRSQRLTDLAQQLRLYTPPCPPLEQDSRNRYNSDKVVAREHDLNAESAANLVASRSKRFKPNRAAVLVCLFEGEEDEGRADLRVMLTKRSSKLSTHSGEVALPGGKTEEGDADDIQTALREAKEEIGLDPSLVDVVTVLHPFLTKYGLTVVPVIGILYDKKAFIPAPNAAEVDAIFDAPLEMFLKDENRRARELEWMGDKYLLHFFDFEVENNKYVIWALTAGILITTASVVYRRQPAFAVLQPKFWKGNYQCRY